MDVLQCQQSDHSPKFTPCRQKHLARKKDESCGSIRGCIYCICIVFRLLIIFDDASHNCVADCGAVDLQMHYFFNLALKQSKMSFLCQNIQMLLSPDTIHVHNPAKWYATFFIPLTFEMSEWRNHFSGMWEDSVISNVSSFWEYCLSECQWRKLGLYDFYFDTRQWRDICGKGLHFVNKVIPL